MFIVITILFLGTIIGFILQKQKGFIRKIEQVPIFLLWLLVFLMGISVGNNRLVMQNLVSIGTEAVVIAIAAVFGSVVLSCLLFISLFNHEK